MLAYAYIMLNYFPKISFQALHCINNENLFKYEQNYIVSYKKKLEKSMNIRVNCIFLFLDIRR